MSRVFPGAVRLQECVLALVVLLAAGSPAAAQSTSAAEKTSGHEAVATLERNFFAALREGDSNKLLSYIPERGVGVGASGQLETREQIEQQFQMHQGLYCKLFDSSCINAPINLGDSARACSYRQLLTQSEKVRTASSEVTRSGVEQAVLVARVENKQCPDEKLIDFIFNLHADGWKLFSVP